MIAENELKIIEEISKERNLTQRQLSQRAGISLGAVNIILKRLVKRGFVKTRGLNKKKVEYMVTPKGFSEKEKKTYDYVLKTVDLVKTIKEEIAKIVLEEYNQGQKQFVILGSDDLADIIELALKGFAYQRVHDIKEIKDRKAVVLLGDTDAKTNGLRAIRIADKLKEVYWGVEERG
jgi:DNA-binding MarR family transcriptional regulator